MNYHTMGYLKPDTPYKQIFPTGTVPLKSIIPIRPRDESAPLCYVVDAEPLHEDQIICLASLLLQTWAPECSSLDEAIAYVREGLPLKVDWFDGCGTSDPRVLSFLLPDHEDDFLEAYERW